MSGSKQPPYGERLLPSQVDHLAQTVPDKVYASCAKSADFSQGFIDVTWKNFANAVNRAAAWIEKTLGGKSTNFDTVAYIGAGDIRYFILIVATNKTGHKLLLLSPRNSLEAQVNLIDKTECRVFLRSDSVSIDDILKERPMKSFVVPSLEELVDPTPVPHIPYERTFEQARADPYAVYHSSGSTGLPKPIISPQDGACTVDAFNAIPLLDGKEPFYPALAKRCPRFFSSLPFFHIAGVICGFLHSVYCGATMVFGHPSRPINADLVDQMIDHGRVDGILVAPSIIEEMTKTETSIARISRLKMVVAGVGPLATAAGRIVSQRTFLTIGAGSTECHVWLHHLPDPEDWQYFMINEEGCGIEMRPDSDRGLSEMVFVRKASCEHIQGIFKTFRDINEYETGDLFEPHPTKAHRWRFMGRRDDMIVLSNGEKVQPGLLQDKLAGHKAVREALVVGRGRFQIAVIIELREYPQNEEEARKLMDDIWPTIEEVNQRLPAHGRVVRPFVMFASPDKPFVRVGKGTMSKPATMNLYASEIEALYVKGESSMAVDIEPLDVSSDEALQQSMLSACEKILGKKLNSIDEDFFRAGADSLTVLTLAATLADTLRKNFVFTGAKYAGKVSSRLIYNHPTVRQLSSSIMLLARGSDATGLDVAPKSDGVVDSLVERAMENRQASLKKGQEANKQSDASAVLLTGSTGSLGSYILDQLLSSYKSVTKVYCLNRAEDGKSKQDETDKIRGLPTDFHKVVFIAGDLSKKDFGMEPQMYQDMAREVRFIIHSQWPVNFQLGVLAFESLVQGVANLATFAARAPSRPAICFLSSIAAVQNWNENHGLIAEVPEEFLPDTTLASSGYGLSKMAASAILDQAAEHGVRSLTLRVGQIAGPVDRGVKGAWPKDEWVPSLIASSKFLGAVPETLGAAEVVTWIPVDLAAKIICELAAASADVANVSGYAHVVSPRSTTWKATVLPAIQAYFHDQLKVVPLADWVAQLKASTLHIETEDTQQNPAVKLIEFYEELALGKGSPRLATDQARKLSSTLRECQPISQEDVRHWLEAWNF